MPDILHWYSACTTERRASTDGQQPPPIAELESPNARDRERANGTAAADACGCAHVKAHVLWTREPASDLTKAESWRIASWNLVDLHAEEADEFAYDDPVDGSRSEGQGIRLQFDGGARAVFRLSGTGTEGATLRVYLEALVEDAARFGEDPQAALANIAAAANTIAGITARSGRTAPDVMT